MAPHSSTPAWRIPGMGEPGGLPSMGSHRVEHDWSDLAAAAAVIFTNSFIWPSIGNMLFQRVNSIEIWMRYCTFFFSSQEFEIQGVCTLTCMHTWVLSHFSHVWLFATPWTVADQAPLSMGLSRQEYWSRLPYSIPSSSGSSRPRDWTCLRLLHLLHWQMGSLQLAPPGRSPPILTQSMQFGPVTLQCKSEYSSAKFHNLWEHFSFNSEEKF